MRKNKKKKCKNAYFLVNAFPPPEPKNPGYALAGSITNKKNISFYFAW